MARHAGKQGGRAPRFATRSDLDYAIFRARQEIEQSGQRPYRHLIAQRIGLVDLVLRRYLHKFGMPPLETERAHRTAQRRTEEEAGRFAAPDSPFLTTQQAAAYLSMPLRRFEYFVVAVPGCPFIQDGRWKRYIKEDLLAWARTIPTRKY